MKRTIYSSGLSTCFHYDLPLQFHTSKSWLHNHRRQVANDPMHADRWALHSIHHSMAQSKNKDTSKCTATLPIKPPTISPSMQIYKSSVTPEAARIWSSMLFGVSIFIRWWTSVNSLYTVLRVYTESYIPHLSLLTTGNVHDRPGHLSTQSANWNSIMWSALGCSRMNSMTSIPGSGRNRLQSPYRSLWMCIWLR